MVDPYCTGSPCTQARTKTLFAGLEVHGDVDGLLAMDWLTSSSPERDQATAPVLRLPWRRRRQVSNDARGSAQDNQSRSRGFACRRSSPIRDPLVAKWRGLRNASAMLAL